MLATIMAGGLTRLASLPGRAFTFESLDGLTWLRTAFFGRCDGVDVSAERDIALERLASHHAALRAQLGFSADMVTGEQVHGREVAVVRAGEPSPVRGADGLLTNEPGVCLGAYVADCAAVFLVDARRRAIGLLHSGKAGTALGILPRAIDTMARAFGTEPADLDLAISPCIRPPLYEIDFAAEIVRTARAAGVVRIHDCGVCTGANPSDFYSYRVERGRTGRMLALIEILP